MIVDVALLGARGQIARTIRPHLPSAWRVTSFSRSSGEGALPYEALSRHSFDLIINAAGPGDPAVHRAAGLELFRVTEYFDNLCLDYLRQRPGCAYVYMSTGAIYANGYAVAGEDDSILELPVNHLGPGHAYLMAKLAAEAKHRADPDLKIADLRVFGYATGAMDLEAGFFLAEAARCHREGRPFATHARDFRRDFVAPEDLAQLIRLLAEAGVPNGCYDACSAAPTTKFEIFHMLTRRFGFRVAMDSDSESTPLPPLDSLSHMSEAPRLGYRPEFSSIAVVERAFGELCGRHEEVP